MKRATVFCRVVALLCISLLATSGFAQLTAPFSFTSDPRDTLGRMRELEERRLIDPALNRVPYERLNEEREKLLKAQRTGASVPQGATTNITWQERGPNNVGGRTVSALFDPNDPTHKKVWVCNSGGGGLWYTNDITNPNTTWSVVSDNWESRTVTGIAADPTNPQVMYATTGEYYSYNWGGGIWKTTDGGATWNRLSSTIPVDFQPWVVQMALRSIQGIVINGSGHVFVATSLGIVASTDGGLSWQYVLAPGQQIGTINEPGGYPGNDVATDLEIGADGILYASFTEGRIYKATTTNGTQWVQIGAFGGLRTELALAQSTTGAGQVVYALGLDVNDIAWVKKSSDAGASWSACAIPAYQYYVYYAIGLMVHPVNPNVVYAGNLDWCRSTNGGQTWSAPLSGQPNYVHGLIFPPGSSTAAVQVSDRGVHWLPDIGDVSQPSPSLIDRNNGYRTAAVHSAVLAPTAGSPAFVATTGLTGAYLMTDTGVSAGTLLTPQARHWPGLVYTDQREGFYLFSEPLAERIYRADGTNAALLMRVPWVGAQQYDYDSRTKNLYYADYNYNTGEFMLSKYACVGGGPNSTTLAAYSDLYPSYIKVGRNQNTVFVGSVWGTLLRVTNTHLQTPTATFLNTSAFPVNSAISCIDVGQDDNELLVTISNYGVNSVWYTLDGGTTWVPKDNPETGLPDVPVYSGMFNPRNRQQVLLGTSLGAWSTTAIQANNPNWVLSNSGMPLMGVRDLRYRPSDGMVSVAAGGRGIYTSDVFGFTPSTLSLTGLSSRTLCAGSPLSVSFTATGPIISTTATYEVWISDADGGWCNPRRIGTGTSSPVSLILPTGSNALPYGIGYRVRVQVSDASVYSPVSETMAIGNLTSVVITDRTNFASGSTNLCPQHDTKLMAGQYNGYVMRPLAGQNQYTWLLNGTPIAGAISGTLTTQTAGTYTLQARQAGCLVTTNTHVVTSSNSIYANILTNNGGYPQCYDRPETITVDYTGEQATFQWYKNNQPIQGATSYNYTTSESGNYSVRVTGSASCSALTYPRQMLFGTSLHAAARFSFTTDSVLCAGPQPGNVRILSQLSDYVIANGGYNLQWYRNNQPYAANVILIRPSQPGTYRFELRQGSCVTQSNILTVYQSNTIVPPTILNRDGVQLLCAGQSKSLGIKDYDFNYNSIQWKRNGVVIVGATSADYSSSQTGVYTVQVARGSCSAESAPVSLTFGNSVRPAVYVYPGTEQCAGYSISYRPVINGAQYQWFRDGMPIANANADNLFISQTGTYSVSITSGSCSGLSSSRFIEIGKLYKPIVVGSVAKNLCQSNTAYLHAWDVGLPYNFYTLQWKRNGIPINNETLSGHYASQSGAYTLEAREGNCIIESDPIDVKIGEPTTASLTSGALTNSGRTVQLTVPLTGPAPWSFTLNNGQTVQNTYLNPHPLSVIATATTSYSIVRVENACGAGTSVGSATVTVGSGLADLSVMAQVSSRSPRVNDVVGYTLVVTNEGPQTASNVQVISRLPAGVEFVDALSPDVNAANGIVTANVPALPVSSAVPIAFRVRVTQPGTYFTAAQIATTSTPDPDSQPNSGTGDGEDDAVMVDLRTADAVGGTSVSPNPNQVRLPNVVLNQPPLSQTVVELSLDLRSSQLAPKAGEVINLSLTVGNRSGLTANNVVVQTLLPVGWQATATPGVVVTGQTVKLYINQLAPNTRMTMVLPVQVTAGSAVVQAQVLEVAEPVSNAIPGNGYANGERDEASVSVRVR